MVRCSWVYHTWRPNRSQHTMEPDIMTIAIFAYPTCIRRPLSEYCHDVWYGKTTCKMVWLPDGETNLEGMFIRFDRFTNVTDGRTDTAWPHWPRLHSIARQKCAEILAPFCVTCSTHLYVYSRVTSRPCSSGFHHNNKKLITTWDRRTLRGNSNYCPNHATVVKLYHSYTQFPRKDRNFFSVSWPFWLLRLINTLTYLFTYWWVSCWLISIAVLWKTCVNHVVRTTFH